MLGLSQRKKWLVHASSQLSIVLDGFDKEEKSKTP
jgi:hypothetical protein